MYIKTHGLFSEFSHVNELIINGRPIDNEILIVLKSIVLPNSTVCVMSKICKIFFTKS